MVTYTDVIKYFGVHLFDEGFQSFLTITFSDLSDYDIFNGYMISGETCVELGFTNNDAIYDDDENIVFDKGNPFFSHFNIFPKSKIIITDLPFAVEFADTREIVLMKAGSPTQTKKGHLDFLNKSFLVDNYKVNGIVVSFDYNPNDETINHIEIRDNNLVHHLKL